MASQRNTWPVAGGTERGQQGGWYSIALPVHLPIPRLEISIPQPRLEQPNALPQRKDGKQDEVSGTF